MHMNFILTFVIIYCINNFHITSYNVPKSLNDYETNLFFEDVQLDSNYIVLILSRLGLANRLRSLADWYQIAIISNRILLVSWQNTSDCNALFQDLFSEAPQNFQILGNYLPQGDEGIHLVEEVANQLNITNIAIYENLEPQLLWANGYDSFILSRDIVFSTKQIIITSYDGILSMEGISCQYYMNMRSQFLKSLIPISDIEDKVNYFISTYYINKIMVGVHFRAHDNIQDWAVVPPLLGNMKAKRFGEGSTLNNFADVMKGIVNKFAYQDETNHWNSPIRFFIASNNENNKTTLLNMFPGALSLSGNYNRDSSDGIKFALIEWLILSRSSLIINTYGSSFADQAAYLHRIPIVGVWEGKLIHHSSTQLPYCGHMQFAKVQSSLGKRSNYIEGTIDDRQVDGVALPLVESKILYEWGIPYVLCNVYG